MNRRTSQSLLGVAVAGAAAAAALTGTSMTSASSESGASSSKKQVICRARMVAVAPPEAIAENYGTVSCTGVAFGDGVQHDTARLARPTTTTATITGGRFKLFFNTGTLRGTYKADVTVEGEVATYKGSMKVSSGTGELTGVTGKGTIAGTSRDGAHSTLTERLALTVPAAN